MDFASFTSSQARIEPAMKPFVFIFSMLIATTLVGCTDDNKAIAEGNVEKLCAKVLSFYIQDKSEKAKKAGKEIDKTKMAADKEKHIARCLKKANWLKEKEPEKFKKVAKCVSKATTMDDLKSCPF